MKFEIFLIFFFFSVNVYWCLTTGDSNVFSIFFTDSLRLTDLLKRFMDSIGVMAVVFVPCTDKCAPFP